MPEMPTQLEVERVINLVRGFGWDLKEQKVDEAKITLILEKKRQVELKPGPT